MGENVWKQDDSKISTQLSINIAQYKKKKKSRIGEEDLRGYFFKKDLQMDNKHMKNVQHHELSEK